MRRRLGVCALIALALGGCTQAERLESTAGVEPQTRRAERPELPAGEGPNHDIGSLGEGCDKEPSLAIEAPPADWSERLLDVVISEDGPIEAIPNPIRIRFPRDWHEDRTFDGTFSVSHPRMDSSVNVYRLTSLHPEPAFGRSAWDPIIEAYEETKSVVAEDAVPVVGGRCLVTGLAITRPVAALLTPNGEQTVIVASVEILNHFNDSFDEVSAEQQVLNLRILNTVEVVDLSTET